MSRRTLLRIEELGDRTLPSAIAPTTLFPVAANLAQAAQNTPTLFGNAHGHFQLMEFMPDAGRAYALQGEANLTGVGHVALTGSLHGVGMLASGTAAGTLTFTGAGGSITLALTGPQQPGFAALPDRFNYVVVSSTGSFQGLHSSGAIYLHLAQHSHSFSLAVRPLLSGIRGAVRVGPISPVARVGAPDSRPLPGAVITVKAGGVEVAQTTADHNGRFKLTLEAGTYSVTVSPPGPHVILPGSVTQTVVVPTGQFPWLEFMLDSGIR